MISATLPNSWELASLLCKFFFYLSAASIAGGSFCLWQFSDGRRLSVYHNLSYMMLGAIIGFQAVLFNFFVQVGQLNSSGFAGMFDWSIASILLDTSLGEVTFYRLGVFIWVLLATLLYLRKLKYATQPFSLAQYRRLVSIYALPFLLLAYTLSLSGHVSILSTIAKIAIILHFCAFALWIGSLYPLLLFSGAADRELLRAGMKRFGDTAIGILLVLFGAGVLMALQLFNSLQEVFGTAYGLAMLVKLVFVLVLLGIAAINKLVLVPRLNEQEGVKKLSASFRVEMLAASLVLLVTAYLSTLIGPAEH